ncbi:MAG: hypothetical protein E7168_03940 [Firmicutes bacterium]|nr:hypothetical protein [Bacillota bacterium]
MKTKSFKEGYSKKARKKPITNRKYIDYKWLVTVTVLAFIISFIFSFISELIMPNANSIIATLIILAFIGIGIIFDMIGISVTVADIKTFNSMATKRVRGANLAVNFIKNASRVSSFCNDVIGDICGIISGSAGVALASIISSTFNCSLFLTTLLITATIAALTIGGKALGKSTAMNKSTFILFKFSQMISFVYRK